MSGHHNHHRHSRHRRNRHRLNRNSTNSGNNISNSHYNGNISNSRGSQLRAANGPSDWTEHRSSSGKLYYYNVVTGISQWEMPDELRIPQRNLTSPQSEISDSSSLRHNDKSPSSSDSSNNSSQYDMITEDKPLLTPSLAQYYKAESISTFTSDHLDELEQQANTYAKQALELSERILKETVDLKIAKSKVHNLDSFLRAQETRLQVIREAIRNFEVT